MSKWMIEYALQIVGDSPLVRRLDVEIDTEGMDIYGADEQAVLEMLRQKARDHGGEGAILTETEQIPAADG